MTIATAGHIDHGKSALVEALTGVHPDRLPEEKRRGITLDLGFGHWIENGAPVGIVDVPGHERLVRTMVAGAAGVDAVLFVVAANEGVRPQTLEHFQICRLLGLDRAVIALTKCDLTDAAQLASARAQVAALVAGSPWLGAPVLAVSAATGVGVAELRATLASTAAAATPCSSDAAARLPARLPIDRVFTMRGFGTVVTGTLRAGNLRVRDEVAVEPGSRRLRIRGLQVHGRAAEIATAAERTAVNLAAVEPHELTRGMELIAPGSLAPTTLCDAELTLLPGVALKSGQRVYVHLHTAERLARLRPPSDTRPARLRLEAPLVAAAGDGFIVRQLSPARTLGGGRVLDPHPPLRRSRPRDAPPLPSPQPPPLAPDHTLRDEIETRLRAAALASPPLDDLLQGLLPATRAALSSLLRENIVVELQPGWILHRDTLADLARELAARAPLATPFSVADFKAWTGLTRARAIPLLEHLDRQRITRRLGDRRILLR